MKIPDLSRRALLAGAGTAVANAALGIPALQATGAASHVVPSAGTHSADRLANAVAELRAAMQAVYGARPQQSNMLLARGGVVCMGVLPKADFLRWYVDEIDTPADSPFRLSHRASKLKSGYGIPASVILARQTALT